MRAQPAGPLTIAEGDRFRQGRTDPIWTEGRAERPLPRVTAHPYARAVLADSARTFVDIAHRIVWVGVATVDTAGRPREPIRLRTFQMGAPSTVKDWAR